MRITIIPRQLEPEDVTLFNFFAETGSFYGRFSTQRPDVMTVSPTFATCDAFWRMFPHARGEVVGNGFMMHVHLSAADRALLHMIAERH